MMYIRKINIILVVLFVIAMNGCDEDLLNTPNPNEPTNQTFWQTESDAVNAVNGVYSSLGTNGMFQDWGLNVINIRGDDTVGDSPWDEFNVLGDFNALSDRASITGFWNSLYAGVFRANQVIQRVPEMDIDSDLKTRVVGEAKFLRGLFYFHLVSNYQNVPLILEPAETEEDYNMEQAPPEQVWDQVIQDFQDAKAALPPKSSYSSNDMGRASWTSAAGYLGRAYLFREEWANAEDEFQDIIDSDEHSLMDDYRDNFTEEHENNQESLFEVQFSGDVTGEGQYTARAAQYAPTGFGWADVLPSRGLFDAFQQEQTVSGNDDPRLYATLFYNRPGMTVYGVPYEEEYGEGTDAIFWRKYLTDEPGGTEVDARGEINERLLRYADILLMYAEANNEQGDQAAAAEYIQMVRDRANLPDRETEFANYTQQQMRDRIAHERFLELAGEGKRFFDIKRWGWFDDSDKLQELKDNDAEFEAYTEGREILPIPQDEIDTNPNVEQNDAY